jgi:hypothetical protein
VKLKLSVNILVVSGCHIRVKIVMNQTKFAKSSVEPFLRKKRITGFGRQCLINYNWGCAHAKGVVVLAESLHVFRLRAASRKSLPLVSFMFGWLVG